MITKSAIRHASSNAAPDGGVSTRIRPDGLHLPNRLKVALFAESTRYPMLTP